MKTNNRECRRHVSKLLVGLVVAVFSLPVRADAITVNFESFSDLDSVTNQVPGLTFSNATVLTAGVSLNEFEFPPHSPVNVIFDDGGLITIVFAQPAPQVAAFLTYTLPVTMTAFSATEMVGEVMLHLFEIDPLEMASGNDT